MTMNTRFEGGGIPEPVLQEAERWWARIQSGHCSAEERAAHARWCAADTRHAQAWAQVQALAAHTSSLRLQPRYRDAARQLRERASQRGMRRQQWRRQIGMAAALLLVAVVGWYGWEPAYPVQQFATGTGERRDVLLDDGSRLLLDTDSQVSVQFSRWQRHLVLLRGQAEFTVAHARFRPFVVEAGAGQVRALGTRFQVRRDAQRVQVALLEGRVRVTGSRQDDLSAGEQVAFDASSLWIRSTVDMEAAQGWPQGKLIFRDRPLSDLVAEMNRHTPVKLRIADPSLNALTFSGTFKQDDQASLLMALERVWSIQARTGSSGEVELVRAP